MKKKTPAYLQTEWGHPDDDAVAVFKKWKKNNRRTRFVMQVYCSNNDIPLGKNEQEKAYESKKSKQNKAKVA